MIYVSNDSNIDKLGHKKLVKNWREYTEKTQKASFCEKKIDYKYILFKIHYMNIYERHFT